MNHRWKDALLLGFLFCIFSPFRQAKKQTSW